MNSRKLLNWFTAEFLVVVSGVLVALALNAWWQGIQNSEIEGRYLLQLERDLEASQEQLNWQLTQLERYHLGASKLLRAFREEETPPSDSLALWTSTALNYLLLSPILGTSEAAISSGEIRLIRNDSLREAIPAFVSKSRNGATEAELLAQQMVRLVEDALSTVDVIGSLMEGIPHETRQGLARADPLFPFPETPTDTQFLDSVSTLLDDAELYGLVSLTYINHASSTAVCNQLIDETEELLRLVRSAIGKSDT